MNFVYPQSRIPDRPTELSTNDYPTTIAALDDSELWREFQAGSEKAFALIYRKNVSLLYCYGLKLVNDKELIKDCIQDLFVEIWNSKHRLAPVKSIKPYLFKSIRRKLIAETVKNRKLEKHHNKLYDAESLEVQPEEFYIAEKHLTGQNQLLLKKALEHLTHRQKEIIYLKFFSRLTYREISETMSLSMKGTYKLMGRSINFLRKYMGKDPTAKAV